MTAVLAEDVLDEAPAPDDEEELDGPPPVPRGDVVVPGYRAVELLRRGSAFDVYDAWSEDRHCRCVLKLVRPDRADDEGLRRHLLGEGRLMLRLNHPHLQRAYEVRTDPPVVVSQTIGGATLRWLLDDGRRRLGAADLAALGSQLASALRYLHGLGYLHLDVKPGNILVESGAARLIDFSLARRPGRVGPRTGTLGYCAPEQAGGGRVGPASDVWGMGATLYKAAAGRRPYAETYDDDGVLAQLTGVPDPLRRVRRGLPRPLTDLVDACLALAPADRPSVEEVLARFDALSGDGPPAPEQGEE